MSKKPLKRIFSARRAATLAVAVCATLMVGTGMAAATPSQWNPPAGFWSTPTVAGYGRIHYKSKFAYQPDPSQTYKIVFALTHPSKSANKVNPSLDHVARAVNLYVAAGVPKSQLKFVAIASGGATSLVMDNKHYRARYGVDNPNLKLIKELRQQGVDVAVCAQAVAEHHINYKWVSKDVTIALSGLTTDTILQHKGYALMPM